MFIRFINSRPFLYGVIALLLTLLVWGGRKWFESNQAFKAQNSSLARTLVDKSQELLITLTDSEMKAHVKDSSIKALLDSLNVKPKNVISYKKVVTERMVHDTLYEYELVEIGDYQKTFEFTDKCFTAKIDLSGEHPSINAVMSTEFTDINYTKRRHLFQKESLPRWGKKETYQTLVMGCGDTILTNHKIQTK